MAYSEKLAVRLRELLHRKKGMREQKMFGGVAFLMDGKMHVGVLKDNLVVRVDPKKAAVLLKKPGVRPMDFTGHPMKGFLYASPKAYKTAKQLKFWIRISAEYVKSLKKKYNSKFRRRSR